MSTNHCYDLRAGIPTEDPFGRYHNKFSLSDSASNRSSAGSLNGSCEVSDAAVRDMADAPWRAPAGFILGIRLRFSAPDRSFV